MSAGAALERLVRSPRVVAVTLGGLALAYVVSQLVAARLESANWDEFALLWRAERTAATGALDGGGRHGLGTLVLVPFVEGCARTADVLEVARLAWAVVTLLALAGACVLFRQAARASAHPWRDAALGVAALALVPATQRWGLQVRTDQLALAFALWGGVAILASRRRLAWAALGGGLLGLGFLCSQKTAYVAALVAVLAVADLADAPAPRWRRAALRAAVAALAAVGLLLAYPLVVGLAYRPPAATSLDGGLDTFAFYRRIVGWKVYRAMLPTLAPQLGAILVVLWALARASRSGAPHQRPALVAVAIVLVGVAVGWFHAGAFPYFWLTLGLFPAAAIAVGWGAVRSQWPRAALGLTVAAWSALLWVGTPYRLDLLTDTLAPQRATLDAADALPPSLRGFHPDGALICRADPSPLRPYLREHVARAFGGPGGAGAATAFVEDLRARPLAFLVQTHRLSQFPGEVREFWATRYVPYRGALALAGARVDAPRSLEIVVPGRYRWWPDAAGDALDVAGARLGPGETIALAPAWVPLAPVGGGGVFALAVDAPPGPTTASFYPRRPLQEIGGVRGAW